MANQTIQNSIDYALTYIQYSPLSAGTNSEPAITIANEIQNLVCGPPFTWAWNRGDNGSVPLNTIVGTQDYTTLLTDFAFLETASLTDANGAVFNIPDVYNNLSKDPMPAVSEIGRVNQEPDFVVGGPRDSSDLATGCSHGAEDLSGAWLVDTPGGGAGEAACVNGCSHGARVF